MSAAYPPRVEDRFRNQSMTAPGSSPSASFDEAGRSRVAFAGAWGGRSRSRRSVFGGGAGAVTTAGALDAGGALTGSRVNVDAGVGRASGGRGGGDGGGARRLQAPTTALAQLRPWSLMVVTANSDDYLDDMLAALRG